MARSHWAGIAALSLSVIACTMSNPGFRGDGSEGDDESVSASASGGASLESGADDTSTTRDTSDSQSGDADTKASNVTSEASDATVSDGSFSETSETRTGTESADASDDQGETASCDPLTEDPSAILQPCESDLDCGDDAYSCLEFIGIVEQQYCVIHCELDCECPAGHSCVMNSDKAKHWHECRE